jgi:hypothetical protein
MRSRSQPARADTQSSDQTGVWESPTPAKPRDALAPIYYAGTVRAFAYEVPDSLGKLRTAATAFQEPNRELTPLPTTRKVADARVSPATVKVPEPPVPRMQEHTLVLRSPQPTTTESLPTPMPALLMGPPTPMPLPVAGWADPSPMMTATPQPTSAPLQLHAPATKKRSGPRGLAVVGWISSGFALGIALATLASHLHLP